MSLTVTGGVQSWHISPVRDKGVTISGLQHMVSASPTLHTQGMAVP